VISRSRQVISRSRQVITRCRQMITRCRQMITRCWQAINTSRAVICPYWQVIDHCCAQANAVYAAMYERRGEVAATWQQCSFPMRAAAGRRACVGSLTPGPSPRRGRGEKMSAPYKNPISPGR
jgi:hypothetical protein